MKLAVKKQQSTNTQTWRLQVPARGQVLYFPKALAGAGWGGEEEEEDRGKGGGGREGTVNTVL